MDKQREELFASLSGDETLEQLIEMGILRIAKGNGYVFELEPDDEDEAASLVYVPKDDIHPDNTKDALLYVSGNGFESIAGRFHTEREVAVFAKTMSGFASRDFEDCEDFDTCQPGSECGTEGCFFCGEEAVTYQQAG